MMRRTPFALTERLRGNLLNEVLTLALESCSILGLVWRLDDAYPGLSEGMTSALETEFLDETAATAWPGAELRSEESVPVRHYR